MNRRRVGEEKVRERTDVPLHHPQELKITEPDVMRLISSVRSQSIDQSIPELVRV
jgi:hypothetical protein